MTSRRLKSGILLLEALNAFATGYYFNYLFFYAQRQLHFGTTENLGLVALHGAIYVGAAWFGGWFGHRFGGWTALKTGFGIMIIALLGGLFLPTAPGQLAVLSLWTFGMCFTWPTLQSLLSANESAARLPRLAGIYNVVWAGASAVSYFIGGALMETLGLKSLFWLPAFIHAGQLFFVCWLETRARTMKPVAEPAPETTGNLAVTPGHAARQKLFLRLALIANPFAYVAINTAIPMIPDLARRFRLSPTQAGIFCSLWFFARMGAFILLWRWPGWHYRFRWLLAAKLTLIASFLGLLLAPHLWMVLVAQAAFGLSVGLIYYSSLFYLMDGGAANSEHGGAHEAAIGGGTLLGASAGAGARHFLPQLAGSATWAVGGMLVLGLVALLAAKGRQVRAK